MDCIKKSKSTIMTSSLKYFQIRIKHILWVHNYISSSFVFVAYCLCWNVSCKTCIFQTLALAKLGGNFGSWIVSILAVPDLILYGNSINISLFFSKTFDTQNSKFKHEVWNSGCPDFWWNFKTFIFKLHNLFPSQSIFNLKATIWAQ